MSKKTRKKSGNAVVRKKSVAKASAKRPALRVERSSATKSSRSAKKTRAGELPSKISKTSAAAQSNRTTESALAEGAKAPAFQLPRDGGTRVSLKDYAGQKLVLFFYPRADTPGCTKEAIDFTRLSGSFAAAGTAVVGVSGDPLKAQEAFRSKHRLSVPLRRTRSTRCLRPTALGAKNPCMAERSRASFAARF
jgi:thioredoxin-dependent peroxiredoxin